MSRRIHESPMDFEFQNGTGPLDGRSPFAQLSQDPQRFPPSTSPAKKSAFLHDMEIDTGPILMNMPENYNAFDSPMKSRTSHTPSPNKPLPATPAFNSLFTTPRKAFDDFDDSSAGETPKSPEHQDDSDATPDNMNVRSAFSRLTAASAPKLPVSGRASPTKEQEKPEKPVINRRESWMVRFKNKINSPGRGEITRPDKTDGRVHKRRKGDHQVSRKRRHSVSDSGDDDDYTRTSPRKTSREHQTGEPTKTEHWMSTLFTFIGKHPTVPQILLFYAQVAFNVLLMSAVAYFLYCIWMAVQGDVDKKSHEAMAEIMAEMAVCAKDYTTNNCDRATRVPALETVCENWAKCMNRDPAQVPRARVSAITFAEIFTSFLDALSYKAMIFTAIIVFSTFGVSNMVFGFFRRTESPPVYPPHGYYQQPPPPTPQRAFSGHDGGYYGTPWHQQPMLEPQPSHYGQIEGQGSPVRRLQY